MGQVFNNSLWFKEGFELWNCENVIEVVRRSYRDVKNYLRLEFCSGYFVYC